MTRIGFDVEREEPGRYIVDVYASAGPEDEWPLGDGIICSEGQWRWVLGSFSDDWTAKGDARSIEEAEEDLITAAIAHWESS